MSGNLGDPSPPPLYLCPRRIAGSNLLNYQGKFGFECGQSPDFILCQVKDPPLLIVICIHQVDLSLRETSSQ